MINGAHMVVYSTDAEVDRNASERTAARASLEAASARHTAIEIQLRDAEARLRENGGNALQQLEDRIARLSVDVAAVRRARAVFEERTAVLGSDTLSGATASFFSVLSTLLSP